MKITKLLKGNQALGEGAIAGGCTHFFGYPITPQSEVLEHLSGRLPEEGRFFLQAESEVSAINMVIGAAGAGARVMTGSSGPGYDLMHEGIGNHHAHDYPVVIADIMRGGPGNGALHPAQHDYDVVISARGDMKNIVLAPWDGQEMYDSGILAFELADKYRNPVIVAADNVIGQSYSPVTMDTEFQPTTFEKPWAATGKQGREKRNLSIAHFPVVEGQAFEDTWAYNDFHRYKQEKFAEIEKNEARGFAYFCDDNPDVVVVAFGALARNSQAAIKRLREEGKKVGLFRPYTLYPYPIEQLKAAVGNAKVLVVEMSAGQMAKDIQSRGFQNEMTVKPGLAQAEVPAPKMIYNWINELL